MNKDYFSVVCGKFFFKKRMMCHAYDEELEKKKEEQELSYGFKRKPYLKILLLFLMFSMFWGMSASAGNISNKKEFVNVLALQFTKRIETIEFDTDFMLNEEQYTNLVNRAKSKKLKGYPASGSYCLENILSISTVISPNGDGTCHYTIKAHYRETREEKQYVNEKCRKILRRIRGKSRYQKISYITKWIAKHVISSDNYDYTSAYEALKYGRGNCMAYALLFQRLASGAGIPCWTVRGYILSHNTEDNPTGGYHIWNVVKMGGKKYYVDACWADLPNGHINPKYFLFGSDACNKTRTIEDKYQTTVKDINKISYGME